MSDAHARSEPDGLAFRKYVLAELRCAIMRTRLAALDIETAGIALRCGIIAPETALEWLADAGALDYVMPATAGASSCPP